MKTPFALLLVFIIMASCSTKQTQKELKNAIPITGTWKLLSGTLIENGDTSVTEYSGNLSFIKIINDSHFAFLLHDLNQGKDSSAVFSAGGGSYTLVDSNYTEHLEYCNDREWEGNDFSFVITINNDTLVQQGVEIVEAESVNRVNIEKYVRLK